MGADIFKDEDCFYLYYINALSYFILEQMYQKEYLDKSFKKYRFHLLTIFRYLITLESVPPFKSAKKTSKFANQFKTVLTNEKLSYHYSKEAESILTDEQHTESD